MKASLSIIRNQTKRTPDLLVVGMKVDAAPVLSPGVISLPKKKRRVLSNAWLWIRIDLMRIRIQHFSNCESGSKSKYGSGSRSQIFIYIFLIKILIYLSLGLPLGRAQATG